MQLQVGICLHVYRPDTQKTINKGRESLRTEPDFVANITPFFNSAGSKQGKVPIADVKMNKKMNVPA